MQRISVFGLGKVGHVLAICLADAGHTVIGVDPNEKLVNEINSGTFHSFEPGVMSRFKRINNKRFIATTDNEHAVLASDISCIIVPTPSNSLKGFSLRYISKVTDVIGATLKKKNTYHLVVVISTMLPGSSDYFIMPQLQRISGKKIGKNLGFCYNPIFIALGEVVNGLVRPDYLLIGESDNKAGALTLTMHKPLLKKHPPIVRMKPIEAEITKIASNTHETMRVSFANMVCALCSEIPGTNVDTITSALSHRMGKRFFKGATPYGGPCWPRDNLALAALMDALALSNTLPKAVDLYNTQYAKYIFHRVLKMTQKGTTVGILGLAYKPGTPNVDGSFGLNVAKQLIAKGRKVIVWDPLAMEETHRILTDKVVYATSGNNCLQEARTIIIAIPMREFGQLNWTLVKNRPVLDCWRCLSKKQIALLKKYQSLGQKNTSKSTLRDKVGFDRLIALTR